MYILLKVCARIATVAWPLTTLTEENQEFIWSIEREKTWEELKKILIHNYRDPDAEFTLDTDASNHGIEAVLS